MKRNFLILLISAMASLAGCGDSFYYIYDDITGPVQSVKVRSSLSVVVGHEEQLHATVYPLLTPNKKVIWTSNDESIVDVNPDTGVVTASNNVGQSATITVTTDDGNFTDECIVTVVPVPIPIVSLDFSSAMKTIAPNDIVDLSDMLVITPADATDIEVKWKSSNTTVASVDQDTGKVTGHSNGTVNITATSVIWGKSATIAVTVSSTTYTVTYDANGGSGDVPVDATAYSFGDSAAVKYPADPPASLTRAGYSFSHWNTKSNNTGNTLYPGGSYPIITNVTFYAQWIPSSTNSNLSSIVLSSGSLNTAFDPETLSYNASVGSGIDSVTITGIPDDSGATVSGPVTLSGLVNGIRQTATLTVTASNPSYTRTYTVIVDRAGNYTSSSLQSTHPITLRYVAAGTFQRDSTSSNKSTISSAFRMSEKEITRDQFSHVMSVDPSDSNYSSGMSDPVQQVNWYHTIAFCNKLSIADGLTPVYSVTGINFSTLTYNSIPKSNNSTWNAVTVNWSADGYRLPTEMEWMWAAMGATSGSGYESPTYLTGYGKLFAGSNSVLADGSGGSNSIGNYSWYSANSGTKTHTAGTKTANELGLFDMSGNVTEWCWDWYTAVYPTGTLTDYSGSASGTYRIYRGGGMAHSADYLKVSYRGIFVPENVNNQKGFRVVRR